MFIRKVIILMQTIINHYRISKNNQFQNLYSFVALIRFITFITD
jgi:hypothetical protein